MGQVLHGSATTTAAVRLAIQASSESLRALSKRYGINPKTVAMWRKRTSVADLPTGTRSPSSTVLSTEDEAMTAAFRRHTLLPLDDCLYALQPTIPQLTRSSLRRCLQRHGISRLPDVSGNKPAKKRFKRYPISYFHIDLAEVRTAEGKLNLFVAIDPTSKFAFDRLERRAGRMQASQFLRDLVQAIPYRIHTILTDNRIQFANRAQDSYANDVTLDFSRPGKPADNGFIEAFNSKLRAECLNAHWFMSLADAREKLDDWRRDYNKVRPHSAIGYKVPNDVHNPGDAASPSP